MTNKNISKNTTGWRRLPRATYCSLQGYKAAWQFESGFRQYCILSLLLAPFSVFISSSTTQCLLLISSLVLLLLAEIVNSAIEAVADAVSQEYNELIGRAKDLGSAAVFTALLLVILIWAVAIYEYVSVLLP
ncbi:MAG: diacylglycerol kinase [Glaciecola sp.]